MKSNINKSNLVIYQDPFIYDVDTQTLTINRLEMWTVSYFAKLQKRNTDIKGLVPIESEELITKASKELLYVYLMEDPRSSLFAFDEEERKRRAIGQCLLPTTYTEDIVTKDARRYYRENCLNLSVTGRAYVTASKTYSALSDSLDETQERLSYLRTLAADKMAKIIATPGDDSAKDTEIQATMAIEKTIKDLQDGLVKTLQQLPTLEDTVDKLRSKWAMELGKNRELFGGRKKGNRED